MVATSRRRARRSQLLIVGSRKCTAGVDAAAEPSGGFCTGVSIPPSAQAPVKPDVKAVNVDVDVEAPDVDADFVVDVDANDVDIESAEPCSCAHIFNQLQSPRFQ